MRQTSILDARNSAELLSVAFQYCTFNLAVTEKTVGDGENLLTYLNSVLKVLLGTDSFHRVPKKVKFCCPVEYTFFHYIFTFILAVTKNRG
jgi:hypothetical protein